MPDTPDVWEAALLSLAAFRTWRLLAEDDVFDRPRRWLLGIGEWRQEGDPLPNGYRQAWADFLRCPWCCGFWIALAWWAVWLVTQDWALFAAGPFALSAAVGLIGTRLDSAE